MEEKNNQEIEIQEPNMSEKVKTVDLPKNMSVPKPVIWGGIFVVVIAVVIGIMFLPREHSLNPDQYFENFGQTPTNPDQNFANSDQKPTNPDQGSNFPNQKPTNPGQGSNVEDDNSSTNKQCEHLEKVTLAAKNATCTETGLTEGIKCIDCGTILVQQNEIPLAEHTEGAAIVDVAATKKEDGKCHVNCSVCGQFLYNGIIPATGSVGLSYTVNHDNKTCTVIGLGSCTDTEVVVPRSIDGYKVTALGNNAFSEQTGIVDLILPNGLESIGNRAFYGCTGLEEITIPESVTSIGDDVFYKASNLHTLYCNSLAITSKNIISSKIKKIVFNGEYVPASACYKCTQIEEVVIGGSTSAIGSYAFYGCTALKSFTIPDNVTAIYNDAFSNCTSLQKVFIGKGVTEILKRAFDSCSNLEGVYISDLESWVNISFENLAVAYSAPTSSNPLSNKCDLYLNGTLVTDLNIPYGTTAICSLAFDGCTSIKNVVIPNSVTSIGDYAFRNCKNLESITLPNSIDALSEGIFYNCSSLHKVVVPDSVSSISYRAFYYCTGLSSITIPLSVKSIGAETFYMCGSFSISYEGTKDQWNSVSKGYSWNGQTSSYIYFMG